jgi:hypothetical protein
MGIDFHRPNDTTQQPAHAGTRYRKRKKRILLATDQPDLPERAGPDDAEAFREGNHRQQHPPPLPG